MNENEASFFAKGNFISRLIKMPLLYFAWFSPHKSLRVFFHKLRGVKIGKNVEIGYFCIIGNVHPEAITICDNAVVTARVTILEHDNSYYYTGRGDVVFGDVYIGENSFIGIGSLIMPGVTIGKKAVVGALSFVNKSVSDNDIVVGIPAKSIANNLAGMC